jgi:leucyl-tRNA synthetase
MPFIQTLKKRIDSGEKPEKVFESQLPFNEVEALQEMAPALKSSVPKLETVEIVSVKETEEKGQLVFVSDKEGGRTVQETVERLPVSSSATPGSPAFSFTNL